MKTNNNEKGLLAIIVLLLIIIIGLIYSQGKTYLKNNCNNKAEIIKEKLIPKYDGEYNIKLTTKKTVDKSVLWALNRDFKGYLKVSGDIVYYDIKYNGVASFSDKSVYEIQNDSITLDGTLFGLIKNELNSDLYINVVHPYYDSYNLILQKKI